jgi:protein TonB
MEQKKTPQADMEQRRTTGFLLGLIFVLSLFYVTLEWNTAPSDDGIDPIDLNDLMHESELVPMSNEETIAQLEEKRPQEKSEELRIVDDDVEIDNEELQDEAIDDEELLKDLEASLDDDAALASLGVDPNNPLNFHISEDLPQFPGGAVEFMKWLTKHLRYPNKARQQNVQGRVVAVFYVEKDGNVSGVRVTKSLSAECDREVMRVLNMMPKWKPGIQNDRPCRTKVCIPVVFRL